MSDKSDSMEDVADSTEGRADSIDEQAADLVPVFMPSLASVLAAHEKAKGTPLSEDEVIAATDQATCVMMRRADAAKLSRPYRDVNPEDPWADWHRVRNESVGGIATVLVLTVLADKDSSERIQAILKDGEIEYSAYGQYENALAKFKGKAPTPLPESDIEAIEGHEFSIEILSPAISSQASRRQAFEYLLLTERLLEAGALAVCCDSSYIIHSKQDWIQLAQLAAEDFDANGISGADLGGVLCNAYMQYPVEDAKDFFTCGLHLLGMPDLIVAKDTLARLLQKKVGLVQEARKLFWALAIYLVTECPDGEFTAGNTFSIDEEAPRFRAIWTPCTYFKETDIRFNHYGLWRLIDPKERRKS
jgi:hypothetical protein